MAIFKTGINKKNIFVYLLANYELIMSICDGHWLNNSQELDNYHVATGVGRYDEAGKWRNLACPFEMTKYSCFWHGDTERAWRLSRKRFSPNSSKCRKFTPLDFLESLRGRQILFLGDSITDQILDFLACTLRSYTAVVTNIEWLVLDEVKNMRARNFDRLSGKKGTFDKNTICPFGALHCHHGSASFRFPVYGLSIYKSLIHQFWEPSQLYNPLRKNMIYDDDILIINMGIHFNDESAYKKSLMVLRNTLLSNFSEHGVSRPKKVFFLESTPQHFSKNPNGYYGGFEDGTKETKCVPIVNSSDWRNDCAKTILGDIVTVIPIAQSLAVEFDAHVGYSPLSPSVRIDCTHYCSSSGIFRFIHRMIYNYITQ